MAGGGGGRGRGLEPLRVDGLVGGGAGEETSV